MIRYLAPLVAATLMAVVLLTLREDARPTISEDSGEEQARHLIRGASWKSHDDDGTVRVTGRANIIRYFDDESARLENFSVKIEGSDGGPWEARAPKGYSPPQNRSLLHLSGGVEGDGHWPDGEALIFNTEDVWVDSVEDLLVTDAKVTMRSASRLGRAKGLRISGKEEAVVLQHDVEIHYVLP